MIHDNLTKWQGKSKGTVLSYRIFAFLMKHLGIYAACSLLVFVALYYFLTEWQSNRLMYYYFRHRLGYSAPKAFCSLCLSYFIFGRTIIDKIAILAGPEEKYTYTFDGVEHLKELLASRQSAILISAHIGNFEIAEPFFRKINLELQISTVIVDMERSVIKDYIQSISRKKPSHQYIAIAEDMSYIFKVNEALATNKIVYFTGDRYLQGTRVLKAPLLGAEASFPAGPFLITAKKKVPVVFVYVMKERHLHYHLYARMAHPATPDAAGLLSAYTDNMEQMLRQYPLQWFNYLDFWDFLEKEEG